MATMTHIGEHRLIPNGASKVHYAAYNQSVQTRLNSIVETLNRMSKNIQSAENGTLSASYIVANETPIDIGNGSGYFYGFDIDGSGSVYALSFPIPYKCRQIAVTVKDKDPGCSLMFAATDSTYGATRNETQELGFGTVGTLTRTLQVGHIANVKDKEVLIVFGHGIDNYITAGDDSFQDYISTVNLKFLW